MVSYCAVTSTFDEGMVKVVAALFLLAKVTPEPVHSLKRLSVKKFDVEAFAVMVTVAPAAAVVTLAVPPLTVTV